MLSGDELYPDDVTSGVLREGSTVHRFGPGDQIASDLRRRTDEALRDGRAKVTFTECAWCEDWGMGMDPEPCPKHGGDDA